MDEHSLIQMRFVRRFQMYNVGDVAAFPLPAARQLHMLRVAEGLAELVPRPRPEAAPEGTSPQPPAPSRLMGSVVRK